MHYGSVSIIFYSSDSNVEHFLNNSYDGTKGIALYEYSNNILTHRLFVLSSDGTLLEDLNNKKVVPEIIFNDIEFALLHDIKDKYPTVIASHMFLSKGYKNTNVSNETDMLPLHQAYYYYYKNYNNPDVRIDLVRVSHVNVLMAKEPNKGCDVPCPPDPDSDGCIISDDTSIPDCAGVPGGDQEEAMLAASISRGLLNSSEAQTIFPLNLAYTLRDSLLNHSNFGRKYINYYYAMNGTLTLSDYETLLVDVINIMPLINTATNEILNPTLYGDNVIIDENFATQLITLLNKWENLHDDAEYKLILENVKYDVGQMKNLTVNQIRQTYF